MPKINPNRHSSEKINCECGCGELISKYDRKGRIKKFILGHQLRGKKRPRWMIDKMVKASHTLKVLEARSGKNSSNWKGGISLGQKGRSSRAFKKWKKKVNELDNFICQECKKKVEGNNLIAHHIRDWKYFPELRYRVSNGITYCRKCHPKIHKPNN